MDGRYLQKLLVRSTHTHAYNFSAYTVQQEILTRRIHRLFKCLTENISMDGHCLLPNSVMPYRSKFDGLAGKHQKRQNLPHQNFPLTA